MTPSILGHRGASAHHPENTLRAITAAFGVADGVEVDVRLTADGHPIIFHDDDTLRLTGVAGTIEARTAAEVAALRVDGEPIPTLRELVTLWTELLDADPRPGRVLNVELKPTGAPGRLITACAPLLDRLAVRTDAVLVVSSFDPRVLSVALDQRVPWRLAFLYEQLAALRALPYLDTRATVDLHPLHTFVDGAHLEEYARPGRAFRAWTVDDPLEARRLAALGVSGIISNDPARVVTALEDP